MIKALITSNNSNYQSNLLHVQTIANNNKSTADNIAGNKEAELQFRIRMYSHSTADIMTVQSACMTKDVDGESTSQEKSEWLIITTNENEAETETENEEVSAN